MREFVAYSAQSRPFIRRRQPAELFHPVESVQGGHDRYILPQCPKNSRHQASAHVVLQACVAVSELIEQASVGLVQTREPCGGEAALFHVIQRFLECFHMPRTDSK